MKKLFFFFFYTPTILLSQSLDVLFIGNSYTYANNMPQMVSEIALSFGDTLNFESSTPGGATFNVHSTNINTLNKISQKPWDYVVLQAQSQEPSFSPNQVANDVFPYAQILIDSIESNSTCTEPIFFMTWGRKYGDQQNCQFYPPICTYLGMQQRLRESYLDMTFNHSATCSPVGICWKESIAQDSTLNLFSPDNSHPSIHGSYLAACAFYSTIFKKPSLGSDYIPNGIDTSTAIFLQTIASNTVLDSLSIWNIFNADFNSMMIGDSVVFDNTSSNYENVSWNFGDGYSSTIGSPNHTYSNTGNYDVTLVVTTNNGCLSDTLTTTLTIAPFVSLCDSFEVTDVMIDNFNLTIGIGVYNGLNSFLNYPYVAFTLDSSGDTIQQGNMNLFGAINLDTTWYNYSILNPVNPIYPLNIYFVYYDASMLEDTCILTYNLTPTASTDINQSGYRKLISIVDVLGRENKGTKNDPLFYIYDDGTVEKKIILE
jgi:PKD repeat protein